ncbi:MAG: hypothetical protein NT056_10570 [Proteobacteria bacterium]|nr:hypothetical protein [Pseudomonadota bacterium]
MSDSNNQSTSSPTWNRVFAGIFSGFLIFLFAFYSILHLLTFSVKVMDFLGGKTLMLITLISSLLIAIFLGIVLAKWLKRKTKPFGYISTLVLLLLVGLFFVWVS